LGIVSHRQLTTGCLKQSGQTITAPVAQGIEQRFPKP
jgi:hypothetical protein